MSTYMARADEVGPWRILCAWLPWPEGWTKHDRIGQTRAGRRFLIPAAREYRARVAQILAPALPDAPWFDARRVWRYFMLMHAGGIGTDHDQHAGGILDDLCRGGLCANDDLARWGLPEYDDQGLPNGVLVYARQLLGTQT